MELIKYAHVLVIAMLPVIEYVCQAESEPVAN